MSGSIQGDIGRLQAASSASTSGRIPIYQGGELLTVTPDQIASGASAVDGPASATDNAIARYDGTTGKLIQDSLTTIDDTTGSVVFGAAAGGITLKQGANGRCGTTVLTAGASTVSNTSVAITDTIILSLNTVGGTIAAQPYVATITASTGFTVAGGGGSNTSTYNYVIIKNAA